MFKQTIKGFTLVELIVVITILAVLSTIGFVSYSSYLTGVRDTNRISNIKAMSDGLELYKTKNSLPLPEDSVEVRVSSKKIAWQGYIGANTLETIEFSNLGKDPKDETYYSYYLTKDRKYFQLMAFLESGDDLQTYNTISNQAHAATAIDYTDRYPTVYGKKMGIMTDSVNTPIQEISTISTAGYLNITSATADTYELHFSDSYELSATGSALFAVSPDASCKRIKEIKGRSSDGVYSINPIGTGSIDVYCDMTTDGGGWTMVARSYTGSVAAFGWNTNTGSPSIDTASYSMGDDSDNINFSQVMAATYTSGKVIDTAYTMSVDSTDLVANGSSSIAVTSTGQVVGTASATSDFDNWGKFTNTNGYWFSDSTTDKGLDSDNYTAGVFSGNLGMVFVR